MLNDYIYAIILYIMFMFAISDPLTFSIGNTLISDHRYYSSVPDSLPLPERTKGPRTPDAPELSDFLNQAIVGLILGDLSAEKTSISGNTRLRFHMSIINKDYIEHLYSIFKVYTKTGPREINRAYNLLTKRTEISIAFATLRYPQFNWVMSDFYYSNVFNKNIKFIPTNIFDILTPVGLAYWIMDDGSYNKLKQNIILCTDSYTKEDVERLIDVLRTKFNLSVGLVNYKLNKQGHMTYRIRINKSSVPHLITLIKPYIVPSMAYKIGL